jgi:hypothetical protein
MNKENNTIVCNVIAFEKEKNKEIEEVNSGAYELGELGVAIEASVGKININPDKEEITYMVNGTKKTITPNSEEFKNAIKTRKEIIARKSKKQDEEHSID